MRISDWSSDVCSSDLLRRQVVGQVVDDRLAGRDFQFGDLVIGDVGEVLHQCAERVAVGGDDDALACLQVGGDAFLPIGQDAGDGVLQRFRRGDGAARVPAEIGRASCRARVWQYVEISVVAVSLKKKKTTA